MSDGSDELKELLDQLRTARAELPALLSKISGYTEKDSNVNAFYEIVRSLGKWRSEVSKLAERYESQKTAIEGASRQVQPNINAQMPAVPGEIDLTADPVPPSMADYGGDFEVGAEFLDLTGEN